jgi:hypothetical protein
MDNDGKKPVAAQDAPPSDETKEVKPQDAKPDSPASGTVPEWFTKDPAAAYEVLQKTRREAQTERESKEAVQSQLQAKQDAELAESGKWQELADQRQKDIDERDAKIAQMEADYRWSALQNAIIAEAARVGFVDAQDAVLHLAALKDKEFGDDLEKAVADAVAELAAARPHLLKQSDGKGQSTTGRPLGSAGGKSATNPVLERVKQNRGGAGANQTIFGDSRPK